MVLESLRVQNLRSLLDTTLTFDDLTALVGANGAGKSAFLMAIRLLRDPTLVLCESDFFNRDTSRTIMVEGTFASLTAAEEQFFGLYVAAGKLAVRRQFAWTGKVSEAKGYGTRLSAMELDEISQLPSAEEKKQRYRDLVSPSDSPYHDMRQQWVSKDQFEADKTEWIRVHRDQCPRSLDNGELFALRGKGTEYLKECWEVLYIPAVQDPAEVAQDNKGSVLTRLVDLVARAALAADASFKDLSVELRQKYAVYMRDHKTRLDELAQDISQNLAALVPGSSLRLTWDEAQTLDVRLPVAVPEVSEDGFSSPITHVGSGLQRACTISLLQQLAATSEVPQTDMDRAGADVADGLPSYMIVIEEPELYQHPDRQRHLAQVFSQLAGKSIEGVSSATRVCYCTHSPLFINMSHFQGIRLFRKADSNGQGTPKQTRIKQTTIGEVCRKLGKRDSTQECSLMLSKLRTIMTPWMNEGFFAHVVVLVEGDDDRGALLGTAMQLGHNLESMGVSIIPCTGKNNLDRPWAVFSELGIPSYLVWDSDANLCKNAGNTDCSLCDKSLKACCNAHPETNERLLSIQGETPVGWPGLRIEDRYACFATELVDTIMSELTQSIFDTAFARAKDELGIVEGKHAIKNPEVIKRVLELAAEAGMAAPTLTRIVEKVLALASRVAVGVTPGE